MADSGAFGREGLVVLWALLHHHLFLKKVAADQAQNLRGGLHIMLECQEVLQEFKALQDVNIVGFGFARKSGKP